MTISDALIEEAILIISEIEYIEMNIEELVDDVILIAYVFNQEDAFKTAIAQIAHSLKLIVKKYNKTGQEIGQKLVHNYEGWTSFHFQSARKNGNIADMRILYQTPPHGVITVRGFGHRYLPEDVYDRLNQRK